MNKKKWQILEIAFFILVAVYFVAFIFEYNLSGIAILLGVIVIMLAVVTIIRLVYSYNRNTNST